jgi:class 3 adenylate cyclase/ketosteroid isomerase-like protein/tetratricopeptide (TPR) repeat protein
VTAVFADLVGSTAFAERLDPEAVRAGLAPYFGLLQSTIDGHAGTVVKFLGDGMFALFGVPEVAEDDALRAVTAAVELQRRFRSFADEIRDRHGVELGLRVGVNTGELVIGVDDVDLVGDVLNTASRLEAACEPGHVLVGEDTWRVTRSSVNYQALGDVSVKGKAEQVATFQVVHESTGVTDELTPFVGRTSELHSLRSVFDDTVASSVARLATVIGDPGVGKTRLARELRAGSDARCFDLRLERRGSTTFAPIADLLREVTESATLDDVNRLVDGHAEAHRLGPVLASFLGHGEPRTTEESFWAVRRLLELLASDGPVIVVVDDIQWAEPLFWDLLDHLVEWTDAPVLLIALARPELRELRPELAQPGRRVSASIALEGLDPDTTLELAARLLDIDVLPAELAERLPRSTDGNPLFVRELVQMLVDDGVLARDGDRWRLTIDADAIEVPPTILSLLASRVERLPDDEREVVELASVIGTEFDRGTLAAIANGAVATRLGAVIDRLRRKDLVEPTGQWAGDHPVYRFHHVLIRDAAYRRLLKGHRAELHERVGRQVDTSGLGDEERDVIVAHHFEQVYRYRSELGAIDDRARALAVEAATRLRSTAEQALGREDLASAGSAAIRALELLGADAGTERDELLLIGCEALLSSADVARGAPLVDQLQTRSTDARLSAWADCFRAQLWSLSTTDRLSEAGELAADAADRLVELGDDAGVAKARLVRAGCLARLGRVGDCEAELDLALGAARAAGDRRRTVAVLGAAPLAALWGPSPVARAGGRCLDVLRLLRITTASPTVEATSIRCQGMLEALRGRDDAARAKFEASRAMAQELGLRHALYETELFAGLADLLAGDAVAAEPHLRAARNGLGRLGIGADAGQAAALLARSLLLQGRVDEADELASGALASAGQNLQTAMSSRAALAEIRSHQGRHDDARRLIAEAIVIAEPTDAILDRALTELAAARVAVAAGDPPAALRHRAKAADLLATKGVSLPLDGQQAIGPAEDQPALHDVAAQPDDQRIWNRVLEIVQRSADFAVAGDRQAVAACYAADVKLADHGALAEAAWRGPAPSGAMWYADHVDWMLSQSPDRVATVEPVAIRGEHHALYRTRIGSDAGLMERLMVVCGNDQVVVDVQFYDPGQLLEAQQELDRRWMPSLGFDDEEFVVRHWDLVYNTGVGAVESHLHPDFEFFDHRPLHYPSGDAAVMTQSMATIAHDIDTVVTRVHRISPAGLALDRIERAAGDAFGEDDATLVVEIADDAVRRIDAYLIEDLPTALARYEEIVHPHTPAADRAISHRAYRLASGIDDDNWIARNWDALTSFDPVRYEEILAPDLRYIDHRPVHLDVGRDEFLEWLRATPPEASWSVLAIHRLSDRGMVVEHEESWADGAGETRMLAVIEFGHEVTQRVDAYEVDDLDLALARFAEITGTGRRTLTNAAWEAARQRQGVGTDIELIAIRGDDLCLYRTRIVGADGDLTEQLVVDETRDGQFIRTDVFDLGREAEAFAEIDRRYRLANGVGDDHWIARHWRVIDSADFAEIQPVLHPEFEAIDHRPLMYPNADAEDWSEWITPNTAPQAVTIRALYHLCDHGVVSLRSERYEAGDLGVREIVLVNEVEDGQVRRVISYDPEDLDLALAEFDAFVARQSAGTLTNSAWRSVRQIAAMWRAGDREGVTECLADDFVCTTYDPVMAAINDNGTYDRDRYLDAMFDQVVPVPSSTNELELIAIRGDELCLHRTRTTTREGDVHERIVTAEVRDGRCVRIDHFPHDQLSVAQIALDRRWLTSLGFADEHPWFELIGLFYDTDSTVIARALADDFQYLDHRKLSFPDGDRTQFLTFAGTAPEVVIPRYLRLSDRQLLNERIDQTVGGAENGGLHVGALGADGRIAHLEIFDFDDEAAAIACFDRLLAEGRASEPGLGPFTNAAWEVVRNERTIGDATGQHELIAVRSNRFCLTRFTGTNPEGQAWDRVVVSEVVDGRVERSTSFGPADLLEALAELDHWYSSEIGEPRFHDFVIRVGAAFDHGTFDDLRSLVTDDFDSVDERRLGFGRRTADEWATSVLPLVGHHQPVTTRIVRHDGPIWLSEVRPRFALDGSEWQMLVLVEWDGHRIRRWHVFDLEQVELALARYEELIAARARGTSVPDLTNRSWEIATAFTAAYAAGDRDVLDLLLDPSGEVEFRGRLNAFGTVSGRDFLDSRLAVRPAADEGPRNIEIIAVRGEHLCLVLVDRWLHGDLVRVPIVVETDDDRIIHMVWFDDDQLIDAQLELDGRWFEAIGYAGRWWEPIRMVLYDPHPDAMFEYLAPDFEYVDHRPLMFPSGDAEQLRSNIHSLQFDVVFTIPRFHRVSDAGSVIERIETAVGELGQTHVVFVSQFVDERVKRMEAFDITQLDEALARYDDLTRR